MLTMDPDKIMDEDVDIDHSLFLGSQDIESDDDESLLGADGIPQIDTTLEEDTIVATGPSSVSAEEEEIGEKNKTKRQKLAPPPYPANNTRILYVSFDIEFSHPHKALGEIIEVGLHPFRKETVGNEQETLGNVQDVEHNGWCERVGVTKPHKWGQECIQVHKITLL